MFWRRLLVEASAAGRMDRPRRPPGHAPRWAPAPALPDVLVRAAVGPLFVACLAAATVLSVAAPERLATVLALGFLALGLGMAVLARHG